MSKVRKPRLRMTNTSTHRSGRFHQASVAAGMGSPELGSLGIQLDGLLQHWIIAVPLHKIRPSHESAMLAGAPVIVPQIEIQKVDGVGERRAGEDPLLAQGSHEVLGG